MALAVPLQVDAVVDEALPVQPVGEAHLLEEVDGGRFEQAGADASLDIGARPGLEDDRLDTGRRQPVGQHQTGGTGPDDGDLRPPHRSGAAGPGVAAPGATGPAGPSATPGTSFS